MIVVTGQVRFAEGEIERLREAMERNIRATRAEDGCARYSYAVDVIEPNLLHVVEEWSDEAAIESHMQTAHMAEFIAAFGAAKIEGVRIDAYDGHFLRTLVGSGPFPGG